MKPLSGELASRLQNWGEIAFHPNPQFNLQFNRYCVDAGMIGTLHEVAARVTSVDDWTREMQVLADRARADGNSYRVQRLTEAAQFYLPPDVDRSAYFGRIEEAWRQSWSDTEIEVGTVNFGGSGLRIQRFPVRDSKGTVLLHGGFDGYYESITALGAGLQSNGYEVVLFEGPGQGRVLDSIPMTEEWERPVGAVLDAREIDRCTIIGGSLGGYLALRAAAFEPRIVRLVCWDVMFDALDVLFHNPELTALVRSSESGLKQAAAAVDRNASTDPNITFLLRQGYRVMGATTTDEFLRRASRYTTADISDRVTQDVLVLAGQRDSYVPYAQLFQQLPLLGNARSVTSRSFTDREHRAAASHCNVGNGVLSLTVIVDWLDQCRGLDSL
jgi:pimeloyl-ACP methyl ester carboxylesterase